MNYTTAHIDGRDFTVEASEDTFETSLSIYRELRLHGTRGALYTSERNHGTDVFRFYSETPGRRSRLPSIVFDGDYFTTDKGTIRRATYAEVTDAIHRPNQTKGRQ